MDSDEVFAPKPVYRNKKAYKCQKYLNSMHIDIPKTQSCNNSTYSPASTSSESTFNLQESDISFSEFQNGLNHDHYYEEISQIFFNDFSYDDFQIKNAQSTLFIERPQNPFFKNSR